MTENLSNDTNEVRDEMDYYDYERKSPAMMCPYLTRCGVPMGMYYSYPRGMATDRYPLYRDGNMKGMMHHHEKLIETIQDCEVTCEHMTSMIRERHDVEMRKRQLELLRDCADICTLMAKYLARHSIFSKSFAKFCAVVCESCGNECAKFTDEESQNCARICLNCAKECNEFAMSKM